MTNYATATQVRLESGLTSNTAILDATITEYINSAHGVILAKLATDYNISKLDVSNVDFPNSIAQSVLNRVEILLASGYLLIKEYGTMIGDKPIDEAKRRIDEAFKILDKISSGDMQLLDVNNVTIAWGDTSGNNSRAYSAVMV